MGESLRIQGMVGDMLRILKRLGLLIMIPLLPLAIIIDILIGDIMSGGKTTSLQKVHENYALWLELWRDE